MGQIVKFKRPKKPNVRTQAGQSASKQNQPIRMLLLSLAWVAVLAIGSVQIYNFVSSRDIAFGIGRYFRPAPEGPLIGRASVIDGDTIEIHAQRIRFNGIDAPESDQKCRDTQDRPILCGAKSAEFLDALLKESRPTRCEFIEWDRYGRFVGDCFLSDGTSVSVAMVLAGHALDWPKYSGGKYAEYQQTAKSKRYGLWDSWFVLPWEYRAIQRQNVAEQPSFSLLNDGETSTSCRIKGNISQNTGARIYHVPGQEYYAQTRINPLFGERWFCTEAEAVKAGWRKSKV